MSAGTIRYTPADPLGVTSVDRLRLFTDPARTGVPAVDISGAVAQPDGTWLFALPDGIPAGTYYSLVTVTYTDASEADDSNDTISLPLVTVAQPGDPIAAWVTAAELATDTRLAALDPLLLSRSAQAATDILWALSGRQFGGLRTAELYVLPPACSCDTTPALSRVDIWGPTGGLAGWWPAGWVFGCACRTEIQLPDQPVDSIVRVTIDGTTVDPAGYRLDGDGTLVRVDGAYWPLVSAGLTDATDPRMRVLYVWGQAPPAGGVAAARAYATELALASAGQDCRLPDRVTRITRQDVEKVFADPQQLLEHGMTGLTLVDAWVHSVNPHAQTGTRPRVLSPDIPRMRSTA